MIMIMIISISTSSILLLVILLLLLNICKSDNDKIGLMRLDNTCINSIDSPDWWSYELCFKRHVKQLHYDPNLRKITSINHIGNWIENESGGTHHIFRSEVSDCLLDDGNKMNRYAEVTISCCSELNNDIKETYLQNVIEPTQCTYYLEVCSTYACDINDDINDDISDDIIEDNNQQNIDQPKKAIDDRMRASFTAEIKRKHAEKRNRKHNIMKPTVTPKTPINYYNIVPNITMQHQLRDRVKAMFYHGYDSYMFNAFPEAELQPIKCQGGQFDLIKIPLITLMDTLDTLVIFGNHSEFRRAVSLISNHYTVFNIDVNVSVFETTIRVLGGLLSAHLMAIDPELAIYSNTSGSSYNNEMLYLAQDLGNRLLPAFETKTGIPFGTVNLMHGVPNGESEIASLAGAGSLIIEFEALSSLTNDSRYGDAAYNAAHALYTRRSSIGLLGKHIHTKTGRWFESSSGVGSNSDSYYEYLLKAYLLFRRKELYEMFTDTYTAIKRFVQVGDWFSDVDMYNGKVRRNRGENLQAFWPGIEAMIGFSSSGAKLLNSFYSVWSYLGFLPEEFDHSNWKSKKDTVNPFYPLRPELIESTYHQYRTTGDRSWLAAGALFLESLEQHTRTDCGYATVTNFQTYELSDTMPSFFLSETCKYLYLLFDDTNFVHDRAYIFSTEAHPFDPLQLPTVYRENNEIGKKRNKVVNDATDEGDEPNNEDNSDDNEDSDDQEELYYATQAVPLLPLKCRKKQYWDSSDSYDNSYMDSAEERKLSDENHKSQLYNPVRIAAFLVSRFSQYSEGHKLDMYYADEKWTQSIIRRKDFCLPQEEPAAVEHPNPQHVIEVNMGILGEFTISVFTDGFVIKSKQFGDTLEISIGSDIVFVRDFNATSAKSVIGFSTGKSVTCSMSLLKVDGDPAKREQVVWEKSCSISAFGPQIVGTIEAELDSFNQDPLLCKTVDEKSPPKYWWQWGNGNDSKKKVKRFEGKIAIAQRGNCMFEDKTRIAESAGAVALIVVNTEDVLFLMSGKKIDVTKSKLEQIMTSGTSVQTSTKKKVLSTDSTILPTLDQKDDKDGYDVKIPTIMITKQDGETLGKLMEEMKTKFAGSKVKAQIKVSSVPYIIDNDYMGYDSYPKIRMRKNIIHVSSRGIWGAVLASATGKEWQLYLMNRPDITNIQSTSWNLLDEKNKPIVVSSAFTYNSLEMYSYFTARKCPNKKLLMKHMNSIVDNNDNQQNE